MIKVISFFISSSYHSSFIIISFFWLKDKLKTPKNKSQGFEEKYFDLLTAINEATQPEQLSRLEAEFQAKEIPAADVSKIIERILKKKAELKKVGEERQVNE